MQNILVTGAYGFIGLNILSFLKTNTDYSIYALDILENRNNDYVNHYYWDELDNIDWNCLDTIIHLAGKAHDTKNTSDSQSYIDINVGLTKKVFNRFLDSEGKKFIFFSTVKAITDTVPDNILLETISPNPQTTYGKSKLLAEQFIQEQKLPKGKKVYILRPCMIHGPGNKGNLNKLYKVVQKGLPWPLGAYENLRSFTSIGNLLFVIQQLIEKDIEPGTYQLGDDEPLSTNVIIKLMAESMNKKAHIWRIWPNFIKIVVKIGDAFGLPLNGEHLEKLTESYIVSNQILKTALGIQKMPYTAIEGMKKTLSSFSKHN